MIPESKGFGFKRWLLRRCGAKIGKNVRICSSVLIQGAGDLSIGDSTWIGHKTMLIASSTINIGSNVDIAPLVYIGTGTHDINPAGPHVAGRGLSSDIEIGDGSWIGVSARILPGVKIGAMCVVGAASLVNKNLDPRGVYVGIPAKLIRNV